MIDIQYLLILQNLREMTGGIFDEFFNGLSKISVEVIYFIPYIIYWSCDKEFGKRFIGILQGSELVNAVIKLMVCAYRPWIRSDLINPAGDSKKAATGYSFPSGHKNLPVLTAVGTGIFFSWKTYLGKAIIIQNLGGHWGNLVSYFIATFFAMVIFPIVIRKLTRE